MSQNTQADPDDPKRQEARRNCGTAGATALFCFIIFAGSYGWRWAVLTAGFFCLCVAFAYARDL